MDGTQEFKNKYVGIDVGSVELVVAIGTDGPVWQIRNDPNGGPCPAIC